MSTIQNLKNFIRHGKQARGSNSPHADPTTNVSNVHAQQQRQHHGITEPNLADHTLPAQQAPNVGGYSVQPQDNQNQAARAREVAANVAGENQKIHDKTGHSSSKKQDYDPSVIERIVAEERESKGKMPRYPGLERWELVEKMGDGAFSNVYRAKDTHGQYQEVAIKVVRKFEMNSSQVRHLMRRKLHHDCGIFPLCAQDLLSLIPSPCVRYDCHWPTSTRPTMSSIQSLSLRRTPSKWRCAECFFG